MSGYFDGLMRASGLPLGNAPVLGAAPRDAAPLKRLFPDRFQAGNIRAIAFPSPNAI